MKKQRPAEEDNRPSASFRVGAIALVFLIIGYQVALFVYKASVTTIVAHRDAPDTVYVYVTRPDVAVMPGSDSAVILNDAPVILNEVKDLHQAAPDTVMVRHEAPHDKWAEAVREKFAPRRVESFPFNPNTATEEEFRRLGFSEKQARAILNYREKGGRYRRKADFARSFVVADSVYQRLEPYIRIPRVDLNTADSAAFDALPGIGPYYAAKMVAYRKELGGYSYPEQLLDLWKFDREKYDALADLIVVSKPYRYPLWTLPEDSLKLHPYIRVYAAHGIVLFRSASPKSDWTVENLVKAGILKPESGAKLAPCVAEP